MPAGAEKRVARPFALFFKFDFARKFREESSFLREYLWKYRKLVGLGLASLLLVDLLEVLPPILLKEAVDVAVQSRPLELLGYVAAGYLGVALVQGLGRYGWRMFLIRASMFAGRDLRNRYARHLFRLPSSFYDRTPIGELMSLATSDVEAVRMALGSGLLVFADAVFYFMTVPLAMLWLSPKLALLAFVPLPLIPWLVVRNERAIHRKMEEVQESFGRLSAFAQESLNGVRVVRAFAKEDVFLRRFGDEGRELMRVNLERAKVQAAFGPTLDLAMSLGMVLLLWVGGGMLLRQDASAAGAITLGTFIAFQRYIQKMVWPMAALGMAINSYQRAASSSNRLKQILATPSDVREAPVPRLPANFDPHQLEWRTDGEIEFRDLRFKFPGASKEALQGISLRIAPGERVAFLGTVGSGKSALLSLLPRLYPVADGMIFVDGVDINEWPLEELRRQVGYVSQDVFLFSETVLENVALGMVDRFDEAVRLASVHEDVGRLVSNAQTRLGERGVNLSGGQRQRLTIARALAKRPPILVLDDALSSVDVHTEEKILQSLRSRPHRNTEIVSAHRISTIQDADRIVVLEAGTIRQVGTHVELMRDRRGLYRIVYEQQRLKEDLDNFEAEPGGAAPAAGEAGPTVAPLKGAAT
jgi:ATP-binding cassette subfamily B protein